MTNRIKEKTLYSTFLAHNTKITINPTNEKCPKFRLMIQNKSKFHIIYGHIHMQFFYIIYTLLKTKLIFY